MKVSVLITAFNHEAFIAQAIEGALAQRTDFSFEIIVGDDVSRDGTREVIRRIAQREGDRVRTIFPAMNLGQAGKALFGEVVRASRGEYLAMLDGDDYWTSPDKLQRQVALLDGAPECTMCFHNVLMVYESGSRSAHPYIAKSLAPRWGLAEVLERRVPIAACSPMFRRDVLDPLPAWYLKMPVGDWPLYIMAAQRGEIAYLDEVMGAYRVHDQGLWNGLSRRQQLELMVESYHELERVEGLAGNAILRRMLAERYVSLARQCAATGDIVGARENLTRGWRARDAAWDAFDPRLVALWLKVNVPPLRALGTAVRKLR